MNDINELLDDLDRMWEQLGPDSRWQPALDKCAEAFRNLQAENARLSAGLNDAWRVAEGYRQLSSHLMRANESTVAMYKQDALRYRHIRNSKSEPFAGEVLRYSDKYPGMEDVRWYCREELDAYIDKELGHSQKPEEAAEQLHAESEQLGLCSDGFYAEGGTMHWIDVADRMPPYDTFVVVETESGAVCIGDYNKEFGWWFDGDSLTRAVLFWAPLPTHKEKQ